MVARKCLKTMGMSRSGIPKVVMVACKSFQQESSDNENWVSHQWCMVARAGRLQEQLLQNTSQHHQKGHYAVRCFIMTKIVWKKKGVVSKRAFKSKSLIIIFLVLNSILLSSCGLLTYKHIVLLVTFFFCEKWWQSFTSWALKMKPCNKG